MISLVIIVFVIGYLLIAYESMLKINKAAIALLFAAIIWSMLMLGGNPSHFAIEIREHLSGIAEILLFLLNTEIAKAEAKIKNEKILSQFELGSLISVDEMLAMIFFRVSGRNETE